MFIVYTVQYAKQKWIPNLFREHNIHSSLVWTKSIDQIMIKRPCLAIGSIFRHWTNSEFWQNIYFLKSVWMYFAVHLLASENHHGCAILYTFFMKRFIVGYRSEILWGLKKYFLKFLYAQHAIAHSSGSLTMGKMSFTVG